MLFDERRDVKRLDVDQFEILLFTPEKKPLNRAGVYAAFCSLLSDAHYAFRWVILRRSFSRSALLYSPLLVHWMPVFRDFPRSTPDNKRRQILYGTERTVEA